VTEFTFERLFSMPAFEGLRVLRIQFEKRPNQDLGSAIEIVRKTDPNATSYDLEAALFLHRIVPKNSPPSGVEFYRVCLQSVLLIELPVWAKLMTLGRGRFMGRLKTEEFRDIRSLFRQARLLDDPPPQDVIAWWDDIQAHVRHQNDTTRLISARDAELLTLRREEELLRHAGISEPPRWIAIEDNTAGYDVLSYTPGKFGPLNKLVEVKSTVASPVRFYLTRNEWEQALDYETAYLFNIWDMTKSPPILYEKTVSDLTPHVPADHGKGRWQTVVISLGV